MNGGKEIIVFDIDVPKTEVKSYKVEYLSDSQITDKYKWASSTIPSILFQQLEEYITPIVHDIPKFNLISHKNELLHDVDGKYINIILNRDIECLTEKGKPIKMAKNQMIIVSGFVLNKKIIPSNYLHVGRGKFNRNDILSSGMYTLFDSFRNYYTSAFLAPISLPKDYKYIFKSQKDSLQYLEDVHIIRDTLRDHYSSIAHIYHQQYYNKISSPKKSTTTTFADNDVEWLLSRKIITREESIYINNTVELAVLINKIKLKDNEPEQIKRIKYMVMQSKKARDERIKSTNKSIEINFKKAISFKKYGTSEIFSLTSAQLGAVNLEYEKLSKPQAATKENPILQEFYRDLSSGTTKLYGKIIKELPAKVLNVLDKQTTYIPIFKTDKICPHYLYLAKLMSSGDINYENNLLNAYGISGGVNRDTFCKICGSLLSEYDEEQVSFKELGNYSFNMENDEMYSIIQQEMEHVILQYTEFYQQSTISRDTFDKLVEGLIVLIRTKLLDIQSDLMKVKTMNENDMWTVLNVYIYIYIFAVLTQFIFTNSSILSFKGLNSNIKALPRISKAKPKFISKKGGDANVQDLFKSKANKATLEKLVNYSLNMIKNIKQVDIAASKYLSESNIRELFLLAYKWTLTLNYKTVSSSETNITEEVDIGSDNVYQLLNIYGKFTKNNEQLEKDLTKGIPLWESYKLNADNKKVKVFYDYLVEGVFKQYITLGQQIIQPPSPIVLEEIANFKKYRGVKIKPMIPIPSISTPLPKPRDINMAASCKGCKQTLLYKFNKTTKEYTKKEINKLLEEGDIKKINELYSGTLIGVKCNCPDTKNHQLKMFYRFYEQYCPKGEVHEYENKKCKKCGITQEIITSFNKEYFAKWKSVYHDLRKKEYTILQDEMVKKLNKPQQHFKKEQPKWEISNKEATTLSKTFNIKNLYNLINNLGLYAGVQYSELENNKVQPYLHATPQQYIMQANSVHNYILYLQKNYYTTKNSEYIIKLPFEIKQLLSKHNQSNSNFSKKLSSLDNTYTQKYDKFRVSKMEPASLANFTIVSLCNTILSIYQNFKNAKLEKFGSVWCMFYIAKIINFERVYCISKLKNLKPLARYQDMEDDTKGEDIEMLDEDAGGDRSELEPSNEITNDLSLGDLDVELEGDSDNEDNLYDLKVVEG